MYEILSGTFPVWDQGLPGLIKTHQVSFGIKAHQRHLCKLLRVCDLEFVENAAVGNAAHFHPSVF